MSAVDPVVVGVLRGGLAVLFAAAAAHKLRDPVGFRAAVRDHRLLPDRAVAAAARGLALAEGAVAVGLLVPAAAGAASLAVLALLALYAAAVGVNLARGRCHVACGCLGPAADQPIHPGLLVRNAVLMLAAAGAAWPASGRTLTLLDAFTVAAGVATLALLYLAAEGLLAAARRAAAGEARRASLGEAHP